MTTAVYLTGPEEVFYTGSDDPTAAFIVYDGDDDGEPTGKTSEFGSASAARKYGWSRATSLGVEFVDEAGRL